MSYNTHTEYVYFTRSARNYYLDLHLEIILTYKRRVRVNLISHTGRKNPLFRATAIKREMILRVENSYIFGLQRVCLSGSEDFYFHRDVWFDGPVSGRDRHENAE